MAELKQYFALRGEDQPRVLFYPVTRPLHQLLTQSEQNANKFDQSINSTQIQHFLTITKQPGHISL